jgi:endo-1,4-beta-xylanase
MALAALLAGSATLLLAAEASADCATAPETCSLAEVATAADFFAGAAVLGPTQTGVAETIGPHFNSMTPEDALKWGELAATVGSYDFALADSLVDLAEAAGARVRGHALVWSRGPLPADLPDDVAGATDPAARLTELIETHIATVAGRYMGRIETWDVVNEPLAPYGSAALNDDLFAQTLGETYIDLAFEVAHAADPGAKLYLNEFFSDYGDVKAQAFLALVERLLARGVPLHGVGVQTHQNPQPSLVTPYDPDFPGFLAALAALGVEIEITELDLTIWWFRNEPDPLAAHGAVYGQLAADCVALPACRGITVWGVTDPDTFMDQTFPWNIIAPNRPLLFDDAVAPKPAYFAVRDAIATRVPEPQALLLGCVAWMALAGCSLRPSARGRARRAATPAAR